MDPQHSERSVDQYRDSAYGLLSLRKPRCVTNCLRSSPGDPGGLVDLVASMAWPVISDDVLSKCLA